MQTLLSFLEQTVGQAIASAFNLPLFEAHADIAPCAQENFGHYQCNSALSLAKKLQQSPRLIAQKMIDHIDPAPFSQIAIAGPGFINFTFSPRFLSQELAKQLFHPLLGAESPPKRQRVIVEFSSPNVAKELHVGHIRSTIIGDCLARVFEFLEQDVIRLNHIGDWGTQFGMLIAFIKEEVREPGEPSIDQLMAWYRAAKKKFDEEASFKKRAQQEVVALQGGNLSSLAFWEMICAVSRRAFQEIYDLLGIQITERGESFYNPMLAEVEREFAQKGLETISNGAKCVYLEGFKNREGDPLPLMIQKSDGGYNYDTTDLAAIRHRIFTEKAERIIYVTDLGQSLHFQMIFAAAEKIGWLDPQKTQVDHVGFGLVLGADGKKFKTRSGETEKLIDLLTEAVNQAYLIAEERLPDASEEEKKYFARTIGIGAVKYSDLSTHRTKDYTFSYEKMLRFEGNTAVFLLYAYVRILGIKRKTGAVMEELERDVAIAVNHPSEIALGLHLRRFGEVLNLVAKELLPNRLTDYLYELAEKFNAFFRDCRVEGSPEQGSRLLLCELSAKILRQGLHLLGLQTVPRM